MAMTRAQLESLIQRVSLFQGLIPEDVEKIFAHGLTMAFKKDDVLFYGDTVGNQMYVVLGGRVGVFGDGDCVSGHPDHGGHVRRDGARNA